MTAKEQLLLDAIKVALATYFETRRRTREELDGALRELKCYLPQLIADGLTDRTELVVKGLIRLREVDNRPAPVPLWMRGRSTRAVRPQAGQAAGGQDQRQQPSR